MTEPRRLKRGKLFQRSVQNNFKKTSKSGVVRSEKKLFLDGTDARQKTGRMDILIDDLGDFVANYEIKATDWDRIKKKNITRNLYRHQKQLWMYIKKYVDLDNIEVCPGIIYPSAPKAVGLRERVESYLDEYGTPAYWFDEIG